MSDCPDPNDLRRKVLIHNPLRSALDMLVRGNWTQRREAGDEIAQRIEAIEARQRKARMHDPGCPADHDCDRDHPMMAVAHDPQPCNCWLSKPTEETT